MKDPLIGEQVGGRYQILHLIGRGGMGAVYTVRALDRPGTWAMKTLSPEAARDAEIVTRFARECDLLQRLKHPHIVELVDHGELADGTRYMILEHLRGEELSATLSVTGPLPWATVARVADQVLSALTVAHDMGVVHRDLKPDNIFLGVDHNGAMQAKILDFGVSKILGSGKLTGFNRLIGTPAYMSPEQADARADKIGPATDVWAFGAIVHEMITGVQAFGAETMPAILYRINSGAPDPMRAFRPDAPQAVEDAVLRALTKDPERRLTTAADLRSALRSVLAPLAPTAYSDSSQPVNLLDLGVEPEREEMTAPPTTITQLAMLDSYPGARDGSSNRGQITAAEAGYVRPQDAPTAIKDAPPRHEPTASVAVSPPSQAGLVPAPAGLDVTERRFRTTSSAGLIVIGLVIAVVVAITIIGVDRAFLQR